MALPPPPPPGTILTCGVAGMIWRTPDTVYGLVGCQFLKYLAHANLSWRQILIDTCQLSDGLFHVYARSPLFRATCVHVESHTATLCGSFGCTFLHSTIDTSDFGQVDFTTFLCSCLHTLWFFNMCPREYLTSYNAYHKGIWELEALVGEILGPDGKV